MRRIAQWIGFGVLLLLGAAGVTLTHEEVPGANRLVVIGVLNHAPVADAALAGFKDGMAGLGYVEGRHFKVDYPGAQADPARLAAEAERLVRAKVSLLLCLSTPATLAAQKAGLGANIPVLFAPANDPLGAGIVTNLRQPGGNTTGVMFGLQEPKRLEWLVRLVPSVRRVYLPHDPNDPSPRAVLPRLRSVADKLGVELVPAEVRAPEDIARVIREMPADIDAIWIPTDARIASRQAEFAAAAAARRIPLTTPARDTMANGALMSFGFRLFDLGRQAARLADQIFRGVPPADLPVEQAELRLAINLPVAAALGIKIDDDYLAQAELHHGDRTRP